MAIEEKLNQTAPPAPDPALDCHSSPTGAGTGAEEKTMANERKPLTIDEARALAATYPHEFRDGIARRLAAGDRATEEDVLGNLRQTLTDEEKAAVRTQRRAIGEVSSTAESDCYADDGSGNVTDAAKLQTLKTNCRLDLWQIDRETLRAVARRLAQAGA